MRRSTRLASAVLLPSLLPSSVLAAHTHLPTPSTWTLNLIGSAPLLAQSAATPPIKMGLWEKKMTTSTQGQPPDTQTFRSCVTPASWQQMVANSTREHPGCTNNVTKTAHGYTFVGSCTLKHSTMQMHGESAIQDPEHIVTDVHMTSNIGGQTRTNDTHSVGRFVSADCGAVKPGDPEDVE